MERALFINSFIYGRNTSFAAVVTVQARFVQLKRHALTALLLLATFLGMTAVATAQVQVNGTGNPGIDIPAVQAAVNAGGTVILNGSFSFTGPGTGSPLRTITISNSVHISGVVDKQGAMTTIANGQIPFLVAAPGADVTIDGLQFENSAASAIRIEAAQNVRVSGCEFHGIVPVPTVVSGATVPLATAISGSVGPFGSVSIVGNDIDVGGTAVDSTNGMILFGPMNSLEVSDNNIRNTTAHGIDLRNIIGEAGVERNEVSTGLVGRGGEPGRFVDAIRCVGLGIYVVEHNSFDTGFENAAGIRLAGTTGASVHANDITMSVPYTATPGAQSAAIQVQGSADDNEILQNQVRGQARVAFSVIHSDFALDKGTGTGDPVDTIFVGNNHQGLDATLVDLEIGIGATNTQILGGSGTISDLGTGTVVQGGY